MVVGRNYGQKCVRDLKRLEETKRVLPVSLCHEHISMITEL